MTTLVAKVQTPRESIIAMFLFSEGDFLSCGDLLTFLHPMRQLLFLRHLLIDTFLCFQSHHQTYPYFTLFKLRFT